VRLSELVQAAAEIKDAKRRYPKPLPSKGGTVRWLCCSEPFKDKTAAGDQVWMASCMYKKGQKAGAMKRIVGYPAKDPQNPDAVPTLGPKPTQIELGGKIVKRCGK
jgi:hypothetical protein